MFIKLKDKEIKDMIHNYESMRGKYNEIKRILGERREHYIKLKKTNFTLKKMICGIIKYKHDK